MGSCWTTSYIVSITLSIIALSTQAQNCSESNLRILGSGEEPLSGGLQYCLNSQWRTLCRKPNSGDNRNDWNINAVNLVCNQLGYSGRGARQSFYCREIEGSDYYYATIGRCSGLESRIEECNITRTDQPLQDCRSNDDCKKNRIHLNITCLKADCSKSQLRLVNGTTNREGRVEICQSGRWGTVCGEGWGDREAGLVCRELGFPAEGAEIKLNYFGRGTAPVQNCTFEDDLPLNFTCNRAANSCNHSMDIGVECRSYDQVAPLFDNTFYNKTLDDRATYPTSNSPDSTTVTMISSESTTVAMGAVIGVLVIILIVLLVSWCVREITMRQCSHKPVNIINSQSTELLTTQSNMNNPMYGVPRQPVNSNITDHTYDHVDTNEKTESTYSTLNNTGHNEATETTHSLTHQGIELTYSTLDECTEEKTRSPFPVVNGDTMASLVVGQKNNEEEHYYHVLECEGVEVGGCDGVYSVPKVDIDYEVPAV